MFGVNYKFQLNEDKHTIKLRPTVGSLVQITLVTAAAVAAPAFIAGFFEGWNEKKTSHTEDHITHD